MLRQFNVSGNCVNTASTTLPLGNLISTAAIQPEVTEFNLGSDAVASNAAKYALQRGTSAGTWGGAGGAAITPQSLNGNMTTAALVTANQGVCSVGPTLTASAFLYQVALNQQATYRWLANPGSGIFLPSTASASLNLMSLVAAVAFNAVFTFIYSE